MTFLKKLGSFLAKGVAIAAGFGPLIQPYLGAKASGVVTETLNDLTQITNIVVSTEAVLQTPGSGADKLKAATPLVLQVLRTSQAFSGKRIYDSAAAEAAAAKIVSGVADFMNALHPDDVKQA